jgi:hypothetical protein
MKMQSLRNRSDMTLRRRQPARNRMVPARAYITPPQPPAREPRGGGPSQDTALYSCSCGFVFEAAVSTSVDCPHCGGAQAW